MSLQTLSEWLRCPNCLLPLSPGSSLTLTCPTGHSFDVNKRGYLSALGGSKGLIGDSPAMLDARETFLDAGWFAPLRDRLAALVATETPARVLDIGCGTGYYLRGVLAACAGARALGLDISPAAVLRTVRGDDRVDGLVADVWSPLPVRDGTADVILTVFAPRNPAEFHRVLRPQGLLAVVIPQPEHLKEIREAGLALDVQAGKAEALRDGLAPWFDLESQSALSRTLTLSSAEVRAVIEMGPSAHHRDPAATRKDDPWAVTTAFAVLGFRRRSV